MSTRAAALAVLLGVCNPHSPTPSRGATTDLAVTPSSPLRTWAWLDVPGRVLASEGEQLVAVGGDLLREEGDALVHDGRVAKVPRCTEDGLGDIVEIAGTFPERAVMLRDRADGERRLYAWHGDAWAELALEAPVPSTLATVGGDPLLLAQRGRGYTIDAALASRAKLPVPSADDSCATAIAQLHGARGTAGGELVVWGRDCHGETATEHFPGDGSTPRVERWGDASVVIDLGPRLLVAHVEATGSEILRAEQDGWLTLAQHDGRVLALSDAGASGIFAIVEGAGLERWRDAVWQKVALPDARTLARGIDGSLWIGTSTALLRTRAPAFEHSLDPHGCDVATVAGAQPYRVRGKRPKSWDCDGGLFVRMASEADWRAAWPKLAGEIELGFASARRRRGQGDRPIAPGTPIEPVVARELDELSFGFALHGDDELAELGMMELVADLAALGQPPPALICAAPTGLPEAEVRRRATRTTSE